MKIAARIQNLEIGKCSTRRVKICFQKPGESLQLALENMSLKVWPEEELIVVRWLD